MKSFNYRYIDQSVNNVYDNFMKQNKYFNKEQHHYFISIVTSPKNKDQEKFKKLLEKDYKNINIKSEEHFQAPVSCNQGCVPESDACSAEASSAESVDNSFFFKNPYCVSYCLHEFLEIDDGNGDGSGYEENKCIFRPKNYNDLNKNIEFKYSNITNKTTIKCLFPNNKHIFIKKRRVILPSFFLLKYRLQLD